MNYYFITGSSSGIGRALVNELLLLPNTKVIGFSRTNTLEHPAFEFVKMDLSDAQQVASFQFPSCQDATSIALINNAGSLGEIDVVGKQADEQIQTLMQVNFTSAAILCNKFMKAYQNNPIQKLIFNISSGAATSPYESWSNYCSAKAALNMFTEVMHLEQVKQKFPIQVYAIAPGVVDTAMQAQIRSTEVSKFPHKEKFIQLKENGQLFDAKDVALKLRTYLREPVQIPSLISRITLP